MSIVAQTQTNGDYFYDGSDYTFVLNPPTVTPSFCQITYSCTMAAGSPRTDLCDLSTTGVSAVFDSVTGGYVFSTDDPDEIPSGIYTFVITASAGGGSVSADSTFSLHLKDPCDDATKVTLVTQAQTSG